MAKLANIIDIGHILDAWLPGKILYDRIPGLSVGIVHKGKLVYAQGFGYADVAAKTPMTPETNVRIASISKTFTAIAILQLADAGKLKLNDKVQKHLDWVRGDVAKLTIRQILLHTGGILRDGDSEHWSDDEFPDDQGLRESFLRINPLRAYRGTFKYSNFGFALLGQIIAHVSGMPYETYVSKHILTKLGMEKTRPDFAHGASEHLARGYSRDIPKEERTIFTPVPVRAYAPAAGFISSVNDLAKYVAALAKGTVLLSTKSKKEALRPIKKTGPSHGKYGLGFEIDDIQGHTVFGHGGSFLGFRTKSRVDAANDIAVITLTNATNTAASDINKAIVELLYGLPAIKPKRSKKTARFATAYGGWYRSLWSDLCVVPADTCLFAFAPRLTLKPTDITVLTPHDDDTFEIHTTDGFSNAGELTIFKENGLKWGTMPYKRLA